MHTALLITDIEKPTKKKTFSNVNKHTVKPMIVTVFFPNLLFLTILKFTF